jgi:hypothetical protein
MKIIQEKEKNLFTCACCGYKTLKEKPPGTYEICHVCGWEDDDVDSDYEGGANGGSLRMCQRDFYKVDDNKRLTLENLVKPGKYWYDFDENWKPLDE